MDTTVAADPEAGSAARCPECDSPISGRFCARCGQRQPSERDHSLRRLLGEWLEDYFSVDGRIVRTLRALLLRPGLLTEEYLRGRRQRYVKPFQLFLIVNVVFLLIAISQGLYDFTLQEYLDFSPPSTELTRSRVAHALDETGMTYAAYETAFNANADLLRKGLIIILVPFLALAAWILHFRRRPHFVPHLVFSVHVFAFYWLYVSVAGPPLRFLIEAAGLWADTVLFSINMGVLTVYLFFALRRLYGQGIPTAMLKAICLTAAVILLLRSYRVLLFFGAWALT